MSQVLKGKWKDLSEADQEKYGSKQAWKDAKEKSKSFKDTGSKPDNNNTESTSSQSTGSNNNNNTKPTKDSKKNVSYTDTADGRIEAPSWYRNSDGSTPSTMQSGMTKEKWQRSQNSVQEKENTEDKKQQAIAAADAYLANHPNKGKGSIKDAEYDRILKEGGLNNHTYQQIKNAQKKEQYEQNRDFREESINARIESRADINNAIGESVYKYGSARDRFQSNYNSNEGKSYLVDATSDDYDPEKDYSVNPNEGLASKLLATGKDFSWHDYNMHKNGGKQNSSFNYEPYGGYQNWYDNHSMYGSNGFTGSKNVMSQKDIGAQETQRTYDRRDYQLSDDYMKKYGKYDWAQSYYDNNVNSQN